LLAFSDQTESLALGLVLVDRSKRWLAYLLMKSIDPNDESTLPESRLDFFLHVSLVEAPRAQGFDVLRWGSIGIGKLTRHVEIPGSLKESHRTIFSALVLFRVNTASF